MKTSKETRKVTFFFVLGAVIATTFFNTNTAQAATIFVSLNSGDVVANDGICSLREAIQAANTNMAVDTCTAGNDVGGFDGIVVPSGNITLTSEISIDSAIVIAGSGVAKTVITAANNARVFSVNDSVNAALGLLSLKLIGSNIGANFGGVLYLPDQGGTGAINLRNVIVQGGDAGRGGGIYVDNGNLYIEQTLIATNQAKNQGGGVYVAASNVNLLNSTISTNQATNAGGGFYVAGNSVVNALHSTIAFNRADANNSGDFGGGLYVEDAATWNTDAMIYSNNTSTNDVADDCFLDAATSKSFGYNIIQTVSNCNIAFNDPLNVNPDTDLLSVDPQLAPLNIYASYNASHLPAPTSPALDIKPDCLLAATNGDQRGVDRPVDSDNDGIVGCDAGAVEAVYFDAPSPTDLIDNNIGDGICESANGQCTLRAAVQEANAVGAADNIGLIAANYLLDIQGVDQSSAVGDLDIMVGITITGVTAQLTKIISGLPLLNVGEHRIFDVRPGSNVFFQLNKLAISAGDASEAYGGGVLFDNVNGFLKLDQVELYNNNARNGGAVAILEGLATISASSMYQNIAGATGGGVFIGDPTNPNNTVSAVLFVENTTISQNEGSGIVATGAMRVDLRHLSIVRNSNDNGADEAGIDFDNVSRIDLHNNIIALNVDPLLGFSDLIDCSITNGLVYNASGNFVSDGDNCGMNMANNNVFGTQMAPINPLVDIQLALNGGTTYSLIPQPGSPAINTADAAFCLPTDQRLVPRPNNAQNPCDRGAIETDYADITIDVSDPFTQVPILTNWDFSVAITNNNPITAAPNVVVDLQFAPGFNLITTGTLTPTQGNCGIYNGMGQVTCNLGNIAAGATATITVDVTALTQPGTVTLSATGAIDGGNIQDDLPADNTDADSTDIILPAANVDFVIVDAQDPVNFGDIIEYTAYVTNTSGNVLVNPVVTLGLLDDIDGTGTTYNNMSAFTADGNCNNNQPAVCTLSDLVPGATATMVITFTAGVSSGLVNLPGVLTADNIVDVNTNENTEISPIPQPGAPTFVIVDAVDPVGFGDVIEYTVYVTNTTGALMPSPDVVLGPLAPANLAVYNIDASALNIDTNQPGGVCIGNPQITCTLNDIPDGQTVTITLTYTAGNIAGLVTLSGDLLDNNNVLQAQDDETTLIQAPGAGVLEFVIVDAVDPVGFGDVIEYTVYVTNTTGALMPSPDVVLDFLDPNNTGTMYNSDADAGLDGVCFGNPQITCNLNDIVDGTTVIITLTYTAGNTAGVVTLDGDLFDNNNVLQAQSTQNTTIQDQNAGGGSLSFVIIDAQDPVQFLQPIEYTAYVTNTSNIAVNNVTVILDLDFDWANNPNQQPLATYNNDAVGCVLNNNNPLPQLVCALGNLAANQTRQIDFSYNALQIAGLVGVSGRVTSSIPDVLENETTQIVPLDVDASIDIAVVADATTATVAPGDPVDYTFDVENISPNQNDATGARLVINVSNGDIVNIEATNASCAINNLVITCILGQNGDFAFGDSAQIILTLSTLTDDTQACGTTMSALYDALANEADSNPSNDTNVGITPNPLSTAVNGGVCDDDGDDDGDDVAACRDGEADIVVHSTNFRQVKYLPAGTQRNVYGLTFDIAADDVNANVTQMWFALAMQGWPIKENVMDARLYVDENGNRVLDAADTLLNSFVLQEEKTKQGRGQQIVLGQVQTIAANTSKSYLVMVDLYPTAAARNKSIASAALALQLPYMLGFIGFGLVGWRRQRRFLMMVTFVAMAWSVSCSSYNRDYHEKLYQIVVTHVTATEAGSDLTVCGAPTFGAGLHYTKASCTATDCE